MLLCILRWKLSLCQWWALVNFPVSSLMSLYLISLMIIGVWGEAPVDSGNCLTFIQDLCIWGTFLFSERWRFCNRPPAKFWVGGFLPTPQQTWVSRVMRWGQPPPPLRQFEHWSGCLALNCTIDRFHKRHETHLFSKSYPPWVNFSITNAPGNQPGTTMDFDLRLGDFILFSTNQVKWRGASKEVEHLLKVISALGHL